MDNKIRIETLCYAKNCGERRLVHDLKKTPQEKVEAWNQKGHSTPFFSFVFFSEAATQNYYR